MPKIYKKIYKCRLCDSNLRKVVDFGDVAIGNNLENKISNSKSNQKYPLAVNNCVNCNHYQLSVSVDPKILYAKNYTYLSGIGPSFLKHFKDYSKWALDKIKFDKNSYILDIGSNDGSCLSFFKKKNIKTLGIDPALLASQIANKNGIVTINKFFNQSSKRHIEKKHGKPFFITSHNVLAHIHDIKGTFKLIYDLLQNKGFFCFEVGYFGDVLKKKYFDTIYHEHLDYHHINPLIKFLNTIGFSVIEITFNNIQGGTLRILSQKNKKILNSSLVSQICEKEKRTILFDINKIQKSLNDFLINLNEIKKYLSNNSDKYIIGYGAPTKAVLLNKIMGINNNLIKYTIDDNLLKINKYLPSSAIKIVNSSYLKNENSVIIIFIYAWNFSKDIIKKIRNDKNVINKKIFIITPLPKLKILKL